MSTPTQSPSPAQTSSVDKTKVIWGVVCLVAPTALILFALIAYAVTNFVFSNMVVPPPDTIDTQCTTNPIAGGICALPGYNYEEPVLWTIINVILFLVGALATLAWLPGIVTGIILLTASKK